jgi:hypothetical protein
MKPDFENYDDEPKMLDEPEYQRRLDAARSAYESQQFEAWKEDECEPNDAEQRLDCGMQHASDGRSASA